MRAFFSLFTAFWSLSLVLSDPFNCTEVIDKAKKRDLDIAVGEVLTEEEDAGCWKQVMHILLEKYNDDKDRIAQLQLKPVITPSQQDVKYNEFVNLKCAITVNPTSTLGPIKWVGYKLVDQSPTPISEDDDGVTTTVSEETERDKQLTTVLRLKVTEEWIGAQIMCGVEYRDPVEPFDSVTRWSSPYHLNVSLTIVEGPTDVDVRADKDPGKPTMSCKFAGSNIPKDNPWRRGRVAVTPEKEKYDVVREPPDVTEGVVTWTLHFLDVSKSSNLFGNYSCGLKDVRSKNASLILAEPAKLVHYELGIIVLGEDAVKTIVLTCVATGVPPPAITWHCSQEIIKPDEETFETAGKYTSKLTLKSGENVGEFSCTVKNKYSEPIWHSFAEPKHKPVAETTSVLLEDKGNSVVGLPEIVVVVVVLVVLLGAIFIAKKRHKLFELFCGGKGSQSCKEDSPDTQRMQAKNHLHLDEGC